MAPRAAPPGHGEGWRLGCAWAGPAPPSSSGQPLSGQPRLLPPPSPTRAPPRRPRLVVGSGVRPTRLCHVCHPPGTQEHLSKIPGGRGRAAAAASGPPSAGSQCQMRAGDKSSIFLVLLGWSRASPSTTWLLAALPPGAGVAEAQAAPARTEGTDGQGGWRAGRPRARRTGAGTWGRPAGRRDLPSSCRHRARPGQEAPLPLPCPGESSSRPPDLGLSTLVLASDLYSQAAPGTRRRAGCSRRSGQGEPRTLFGKAQGQKSRTFGTEAGVQTESVSVPGRVRQRQVIAPPDVPVSQMRKASPPHSHARNALSPALRSLRPPHTRCSFLVGF
ncbi:uncharacterized protein LOC116592632 [Mustela erminea]|uniref:uncharacterized protein LOC116592632 n=1 Tax=Mustela erminea TaxID=36723 RepID=UPI001387364D|nr:uncharacterized protein LOC116592632 [Mustela erminea]